MAINLFRQQPSDRSSRSTLTPATSANINPVAAIANEFFEVNNLYAEVSESLWLRDVESTTSTRSKAFTAWNPSDLLNITLTNSNTTSTGNNLGGAVRSVLSKSTTGKWVAEFTINTKTVNGNCFAVGIANATASLMTIAGQDANTYVLWDDGLKGNNNVYTALTGQINAGDIISVLWDAAAGTINFWKNGVDFGTAFTGITGTWYFYYYGYLSNNAATCNFGSSPYLYSYPAGYGGMSIDTISESISESIVLVDVQSVPGGTVYNVSISESISLSDADTAQQSIYPSISEAITLTDDAVAQKSSYPSLSESISFTDSDASIKEQSATITELTTLAEVVAASNIMIGLVTEAINLSDVPSLNLITLASVIESISLSEAITNQLTISSSLTEALSFSEAVTLSKVSIDSVTESISLSDVASTIKIQVDSILEIISLTDDVNAQLIANILINESLILDDTQVAIQEIYPDVVETVVLTEDVDGNLTIIASTIESLVLTDIETAIKEQIATVDESILLSDTISAYIEKNADVSESINLIEAISKTLILNATVTESITLDEGIGEFEGRIINETINLVDTITVSVVRNVSITETITLKDYYYKPLRMKVWNGFAWIETNFFVIKI